MKESWGENLFRKKYEKAVFSLIIISNNTDSFFIEKTVKEILLINVKIISEG